MKHGSMKYVIWLSVAVIVVAAYLFTLGPASPSRRSPQRATLQLQWVAQAQFAGYYVALDKGWYREEGIDLTINPGGADIVPIDQVVSGKSDFGTSFLADLCVGVRKGKPIISIAQLQPKSGLLLIAKKTSGIREPRDFIGRRVGVWLGGWDAQFNALLANEGIDARDVGVISQGYDMAPFLNGETDVASAMVYNEYLTVLESGIKPADLNVIDYAEYGLGLPGDILFTTREMAEQRPDTCARMVGATLRGWQYAIEHPEEAVDIVLKHDKSGRLDRAHQLSMMNEIAKLMQRPGRDIGYTERIVIKQTIYVLRDKVLGGPLQPEDVYTNDFWEQASQRLRDGRYR